MGSARRLLKVVYGSRLFSFQNHTSHPPTPKATSGNAFCSKVFSGLASPQGPPIAARPCGRYSSSSSYHSLRKSSRSSCLMKVFPPGPCFSARKPSRLTHARIVCGWKSYFLLISFTEHWDSSSPDHVLLSDVLLHL